MNSLQRWDKTPEGKTIRIFAWDRPKDPKMFFINFS
jgi:hypothetical protein